MLVRPRDSARSELASNHHYFRGLDQSVDANAFFQPQSPRSITGYYRSYPVTTHIDRHLHQQSFITKFGDCSRQLVAAANRVETNRFTLSRTLFPTCSRYTLDLAARDTMMATGSGRRTNLSVVNPLLQRRVTDTG